MVEDSLQDIVSTLQLSHLLLLLLLLAARSLPGSRSCLHLRSTHFHSAMEEHSPAPPCPLAEQHAARKAANSSRFSASLS